jgi:hypothetical protein
MNAVAELSQATENYLSDRAVSKPRWTFTSQAVALGMDIGQAIMLYEPDPTGWNYWHRNYYKLTTDTPLELEWLDATVKGLGSTLRLDNGWDTYNAAPVSPSSVQRALAFLFRFLEPSSPTPSVVPLSDGGVQMEWHRGGLDIEVTFSPREVPELYVRDLETGDEWEGDATTDLIEQVRPLLARLRVAQ